MVVEKSFGYMGGDRPKFAVDAMLGRMARWLRFMGFDTLYTYARYPGEIGRFVRDGRIFVTRNRKWRNMEGVVIISANDFDDQIIELARAIDLTIPDDSEWLSRCGDCNALLEKVDRQSVAGKVPEYVWETFNEFFQCPLCGKIFWSGSHVERMERKLEELKKVLSRKRR